MKRRTLPIGSYTSETTHVEARMTDLAWHLRHVRLSRTDRQRLIAWIKEADDAIERDRVEDIDDLYVELVTMAERYVLPYTYIGTCPGDSADFGVWIDHERIVEDMKEGDVVRDTDLNDSHADYVGYVVSISDHGNVSLTRYVRGRRYPVW